MMKTHEGKVQDLGITFEGEVIPGEKPSEHLREKPIWRYPLRCTNSLWLSSINVTEPVHTKELITKEYL